MPDSTTLQQLLRLQTRDAVFVHPVDMEAQLAVPIIDANDVACAMLGYAKEELLTLTMADITTSEVDTGKLLQFMEEGFTRNERTAIAKDGSRIPIEFDAHAIDIDGKQMCLTVVRDISERKRAEQERTLNARRFQALYQISQMMDLPEQAILDFALEESVSVTGSAIGYIYLASDDESELILHAWSKDVMRDCKILNPQTRYKVSETGLWGEAVRQRKPIITNDYANAPDRRGMPEGHVPVKRHMNLPIIDDGRIVIVAGVGNKDEEYSESDVVQLTLLMEGMWRIIQRKRMERDLLKAKQEAERANRTKDRFLANMSHELRTPLNGILGMTQILKNTSLTPEQQEYLNLTMEASRHLNRALADLLALSSIESGVITLVTTNFDLHDTLDALIKPLTVQAREKSLALNLEIAQDVPDKLRGDAGKLRQILINMLMNAIKFTESGTVTLEVATEGKTNGHCDLRFTVTDTGMGVPADKRDAIFDSFTLGEDYMTKEFGGTGLGLSISHRLAHMLKGDIVLEESSDKGSTFVLTVPMTVRAEPSIPAEEHGPLKILLAEDEQVNSLMASRLLRKEGHSVTIVGNGQQAMDALSKERFDLVLMDVQMPVVNGLQATRFIRSGAVENVPKDLPIIGLTAFARSDDRKQFMEAGMEHIVTKPYEASDLMQAIAVTMQRR